MINATEERHQMLSAAIVDDEPLARSRFRRVLEKVAGHRISIVAECVDVADLLDASSKAHIDVLFLDIKLPGRDGFAALQQWNGPLPLVVFVTAYEHHGVRAFAANAVDYLMKPVSVDRLRETFVRLEHRLPSSKDHLLKPGRKVSFDVGRRTVVLDEHEIDVIRAKGNYLDVETSSGTFTRRQPMTDFLQELTPNMFSRVHRSAAIRSSAITDILALGSGRYIITLGSGKRVVSGRLYSKVVQGMAGRRCRRDHASDG